MAENNSTQETNPSESYTEDYCDKLSRKAAQLDAVLSTACGAGFESFMLYNDTIKENYLWACADLARDIKDLAEHVKDRD